MAGPSTAHPNQGHGIRSSTDQVSGPIGGLVHTPAKDLRGLCGPMGSIAGPMGRGKGF